MKGILALAGALILMTLSITSCLVTNERYDKLTPGIWRGELFLDESNPLSKNISKVGNDQDITFKNAFTEGALPFNFEVSYLEGDSLKKRMLIFGGVMKQLASLYQTILQDMLQ